MVLDIEQFKIYKQKLLLAIKNDDIPEYVKMFNELISYDLCQIPSNEWEGIVLYSPDTLDMSNTHANLDFSYLEGFECKKIILDGCNVQHLERILYDRDIFTDEFINSHSDYFPSNLPDDVLSRFYNKGLTAKNYLECPKLKEYSYYSSRKDDMAILIQIFGLSNAIRFIEENKEFFMNNDYLYLSEITNIPDSLSYEEGKKIIYDNIIKSVPSYLVYFYKSIPSEYKESHPDVFIDESSLSEEFVNKYYSKKLELMDVKNNFEILKSKNRKVYLNFDYQLANLDLEQLVQMPDAVVKSISKYLSDHIVDHPISFDEESIKGYVEYSVGTINMSNISIKDLDSYSQYLEPQRIKELVHDNDVSTFLNLWHMSWIIEYSKENNDLLDEKISYSGNSKSLSSLFLDYVKEHYSMSLRKHDFFDGSKLGEFINFLPFLFPYDAYNTIDEFLLSMYLDKDNKYHDPSNQKTFDKIKNRITNYLLDEELLANILKDVIYGEDLKNDIIDHFYEDFYDLAYDVNSAAFYSGNPDILKDLFLNKKLTCKNLPIIDKTDDDGKNVTLSNERIYEIMSKYGVLISQVKDNGKFLSDLWPLFLEDNYEELVNNYIEENILNIESGKGRFKLSREVDVFDFSALPASFTSKHPELVLNENAPDLLQDCFYDDPSALFFLYIENTDWKEFLLPLDFNQLIIHRRSESDDITSPLRSFVAHMLEMNFDNARILDYVEKYGSIITKYNLYSNNLISIAYHNPDSEFIKDFNNDQELLEQLQNGLVFRIQNGYKYDEGIYKYIGNIVPDAFLNPNVPEDIKSKFYSKEFSIQDFIDDPSLFDKLGNVNIIYGFNYKEYSWIAALFSNVEDSISANRKRLQIMYEYEKLDNAETKKFIKDELIANPDIEEKDIHEIFNLITRLRLSNSIELQNFAGVFAKQLIHLDDKYKKIEEMEEIFTRNHLPLFGKIFLCFQKLYPVLSDVEYTNGQQRFRFDESSRISPQLKDDSIPNFRWIKDNNTKRMAIIFNDLLRIAYRSNERSLMDYISSIEYGDAMYKAILTGRINLDDIPEQFQDKLEVFVDQLEMLYSNTVRGKENPISFENIKIVQIK